MTDTNIQQETGRQVLFDLTKTAIQNHCLLVAPLGLYLKGRAGPVKYRFHLDRFYLDSHHERMFVRGVLLPLWRKLAERYGYSIPVLSVRGEGSEVAMLCCADSVGLNSGFINIACDKDTIYGQRGKFKQVIALIPNLTDLFDWEIIKETAKQQGLEVVGGLSMVAEDSLLAQLQEKVDFQTVFKVSEFAVTWEDWADNRILEVQDYIKAFDFIVEFAPGKFCEVRNLEAAQNADKELGRN